MNKSKASETLLKWWEVDKDKDTEVKEEATEEVIEEVTEVVDKVDKEEDTKTTEVEEDTWTQECQCNNTNKWCQCNKMSEWVKWIWWDNKFHLNNNQVLECNLNSNKWEVFHNNHQCKFHNNSHLNNLPKTKSRLTISWKCQRMTKSIIWVRDSIQLLKKLTHLRPPRSPECC